jgi:hypothetical protein
VESHKIKEMLYHQITGSLGQKCYLLTTSYQSLNNINQQVDKIHRCRWWRTSPYSYNKPVFTTDVLKCIAVDNPIYDRSSGLVKQPTYGAPFWYLAFLLSV